MRFGLTFFPAFDPAARSARDYYAEALALSEQADRAGLEHVQIVEHHGSGYGGYSPDPALFLAAVASRTERIRLTTGAVVPAFDHPLRLAGALAQLDALCGGRLDAGFGRAFLPSEFRAFGVPMDQSRERFERNVELIRRLWTEQEVSSDLPWARFGPVTLQPRPVQHPHPPVFVAATTSAQSAAAAGREGFHLQLVPTVVATAALQEMLAAFREARTAAGHGPGRIQIKYNCYLGEDEALVRAEAERWERAYISLMRTAVAEWARTESPDYRGYEALVDKVDRYDFAASVAGLRVLLGTPAMVREQLAEVAERFGSDVTVSLHLNPGLIGRRKASRSLELLVSEVVPAFSGASRCA